jgi:hypothetical protein
MQSGKKHLSFESSFDNVNRLTVGMVVFSITLLLTISYGFFVSAEIGGLVIAESPAFAQEISNGLNKGNVNSSSSNNLTESVSNNNSASEKSLTGMFVGAGDGIHNAEGTARVISLEDGSRVLRFENLKSTNGPDLYVYLATDKGASDFVDLGRLKGNIGNQNYNIPQGTDLSKHNTILIWCKQFSVLFGSANLNAN